MKKRILIVDDEENVRFFLAENLALFDPACEIETASSGYAALSQLVAEPFDLLITDLRLSGMSGLDLIRRARQISPRTRTILITAYGSSLIEAEAHHLHAHHYITKPFCIEQFIQATQEALRPLNA